MNIIRRSYFANSTVSWVAVCNLIGFRVKINLKRQINYVPLTIDRTTNKMVLNIRENYPKKLDGIMAPSVDRSAFLLRWARANPLEMVGLTPQKQYPRVVHVGRLWRNEKKTVMFFIAQCNRNEALLCCRLQRTRTVWWPVTHGYFGRRHSWPCRADHLMGSPIYGYSTNSGRSCIAATRGGLFTRDINGKAIDRPLAWFLINFFSR